MFFLLLFLDLVIFYTKTLHFFFKFLLHFKNVLGNELKSRTYGEQREKKNSA